MFDPETQAFLESGCGLIVATVSGEGEPHAARAWGLDLLEPGPPARMRLLLDPDDERTIAHAASRGAIAVTGANVLTLRSMQLKGRAVEVAVASPDDAARADRYIRAFYADVEATDRVPWERFEHFLPAGYVTCTIEVHDVFDQTPGPGAGARVGAG